MSLVAFVAPSGDVMFAMSLGLSGHPSPPPPPLLPPSIHRCSFSPPVSLSNLPPRKTATTISPVCYYLWLDPVRSCQSNRPATPLILKASEEPLALNTDSSAWRCAEARKRRSEQFTRRLYIQPLSSRFKLKVSAGVLNHYAHFNVNAGKKKKKKGKMTLGGDSLLRSPSHLYYRLV